MSDDKKGIPAARLLRYNFGKPQNMTWGWALMIFSLLALLFYGLRCLLKDPESPLCATNIAGASILMLLMTLITEVGTTVFFSRGFEDRITGHFTGVGALLLAFLSGIPLTMIAIPLYNLPAYLTLRFNGKSIFPVFFHPDPESASQIILFLLSDAVIPAFGASLFFFGFLWSRFKSADRSKAYWIIAIAYALFMMDFNSFLSAFAVGIWCCYLRSRIHNIWAPFVCLFSMSLVKIVLPKTMSAINIFEVQTYADVGSTYFYSSLPSFFMGMVLLLFFIRMLDSFSYAVRHEVKGDEYDDSIPSFNKSMNLTFIVTAAAFAAIILMMIKGVHL